MERVLDLKLIEYYQKKYSTFKWTSQPEIELHYFKTGEQLFEVGAREGYLYLLVNGTLKITYPFENGKTMLLKFYKPPVLVGDIELYNNLPIMSTVIAVDETHLLALPVDIARDVCLHQIDFLEQLVDSLSEKLASTINNSAYNYAYPLSNRLASYIINRADETHSDVLDIAVSFEDVAQFLGTTYRHLHRTLSEFVDLGYIQVENKTVKILERDALEALAVGEYRKLI